MSEDEDLPLRRRVPGAARAAPAQAARPALPEAVLRRMQAAVDAARVSGDDGPVTEPIPKITAQIAPAKTREGDDSPSASRGRVVEFKRPAKRHRGQSAAQAKRADQPKHKHGSADPAKSTPQAREQAPAAPSARDTQQPPAAPQNRNGQRDPAAPAAPSARDTQQPPAAAAAPQSRNGQQAQAAPSKPAAAPPWEQRPSGSSPAGTRPPPLPKRPPAESPPAAARSDRDTAAAAPPADPKDAPPRVLAGPAGPSAAGAVPPAPPADMPAAAAESPLRTAPTPAADPAAPGRAASHSPKDLRAPRKAGNRPQSGRSRRVIGIAASMVIALAIGGVAIALAARGGSGNPGRHKNSTQPGQELANTAKAVAWIGDQVNPGSVIACDPSTCAAIQAGGYPAGDLQVLKPTTPYPRTAALVVETSNVRSIYGSSLSSDWAPAVLTRIGKGAAEIEIRVIAPGGAAAYQRALLGDLAARKQVGTSLLHGGQITTSTNARKQVIAGAVDWRLLVAIAQVAGQSQYPVDIIGFGNDAVGATPGLPLRYADLSEHVPAAGMTAQGYVAAMAAALQQLPTSLRPLRTESVPLRRGGFALRVEFAAPSPLNPVGPAGG